MVKTDFTEQQAQPVATVATVGMIPSYFGADTRVGHMTEATQQSLLTQIEQMITNCNNEEEIYGFMSSQHVDKNNVFLALVKNTFGLDFKPANDEYVLKA